MKAFQSTALILCRPRTSLDRTISILEERGYAIHRIAQARAGRECLPADPPSLILLEASLPRAAEAAAEAAARWPHLPIAILCSRRVLYRVAMDFKAWAFEFLPLPEDPLALRLVLRRVQRDAQRQQETAQGLAEMENRTARQVDDERSAAVEQIVDKMATFIAKIAAEAQGGVQYFNELPYFVSVHSHRGEIIAANSAYAMHFGSPLPRSIWEVYSGKRAAARTCPVGLSLHSGTAATTRAVVRYQSGLRVPVIVHTAPIFDRHGRAVLILEVFAGTREIELLARDIHTTQQRYQQLFDVIPFHATVLDRRFCITAVNQRFEKDFGNPVGESFFDVLRPARFPPYRGPITQTLRDGQPHQGEVVMTDRRGRQYNMMAWTSPITTQSGKLVQTLVLFTDVTAQRRKEDDLATLGLTISTLAHNLKGSLTGLEAGLYLIEKGFYRNHQGRIEEGLDLLKMMAERLRSMVTDILYSSKGNQGTGLGLYITRRVIQRHGGEIVVDANPGQGARFRIRLPRRRKFDRLKSA